MAAAPVRLASTCTSAAIRRPALPSVHGRASILRTDETLRKTRLVALTGYAQPEDRAHAIAAGFDDHLAKPPDLAAIDALLAQKA